MIYKYIGRHQMNRRSYLCLYVYDNSKEFKIGIAGFSIYGTKSEKLKGEGTILAMTHGWYAIGDFPIF